MFLVNSHPATVLFDTGASHSFISAQFVKKHSLGTTLMKTPMLVKSPGGNFESSHMCPSLKINIRGVDFPTQLMIMESDGIEVILGMNWLDKYKEVVHCSEKTVVLTSPTGERIEVVTSLPRSEPASMD